ncbi:RNA ligase family protein [Xanthobacter autotrophicus]|uniref:RNA ligase family protein n=1 Tax=Xanthobacter autotrophicus TaxID=280 RepID=UPI003726B00D
MKEYHKIDTVFKRDMNTKFKTLLMGEYSNDTFRYLAKNEWVFTEKVDGTNIRVIIANGSITFGGKTDNAQIPASLVKRLEDRFHPQKDALLDAFPDGGCLYGEGYGARIQKGGGNYRADQDFVLFDARVGEWWLERDAIENVAAKFGLNVVPIIGRGTLHEMIIKAASGFYSAWGDFVAEGIVARPAVELKTRNNSRIITKIKHSDFRSSAENAA